MNTIESRYENIKKDIPANVKLVAVSKFHPSDDIQALYNVGHRAFGESRVQELDGKQRILPADVEWHFIGHLQTNKIKNIVPYVSLIHGVDSFHLLKEIDKESRKQGRVTNCLLQMHVAQEETKFGFSEDELNEMLASAEWRTFQNVCICGIMGMASNVDDESVVRKEFRLLKHIFYNLKKSEFKDNVHFVELSMGMSGDYKIAIEEGSTMVRIGTSIFGERIY